MPDSLRTVINMAGIIRIHIVMGGILAYSLGVLLAILSGSSLDPTSVVIGYLIIFLADLSTHYSNDYFDFTTNPNGERNKTFGGSRVLAEHPELGPTSRLIAIALIILSVSLASFSAFIRLIPVELVMIVVAANLLGWFYSAPPIRLSTRGLGEFTIALGTGFLIPAAGYVVVKGQLDTSFLLLAIPFVMYGFILALSLEVPDMEDDLRVGKNNLVVRKGRRFAFSVILALSVLATLAFSVYTKEAIYSTVDLAVVAAFSSVPVVAGLMGVIKRPERRDEANRFGSANVIALFLFNVLMVAYLTLLTL
jgi:1,4-dihydroxy-2-naphthoate octaprenyltransferase